MSINLSSNFNLVTQLPLDARYVAVDITARDAIANIQRFEGLQVYVLSDTTLYMLIGGITNADWMPIGTGAPGADGNSVLNGVGPPGAGVGVDGDFYIDTATWDIYGPKTAGVWGAPTSLIGPAGADGNTVLNGAGPPGGGTGVDGDFYIDTTTWEIYGPKAGGVWGAPTSLIGPSVAIEWEGVEISPIVSRIDFKGPGVTNVVETAPGEVEITIVGSGSGGACGDCPPTVYGECAIPLPIDPTQGLRTTESNMNIYDENQVVFVEGDGSAVTDITAVPQVEPHSLLGAEIIVVGKSNATKVLFENGDGLFLNGDAELGQDDILILMWRGDGYVEIRRNF